MGRTPQQEESLEVCLLAVLVCLYLVLSWL